MYSKKTHIKTNTLSTTCTDIHESKANKELVQEEIGRSSILFYLNFITHCGFNQTFKTERVNSNKNIFVAICFKVVTAESFIGNSPP